jgi:hypothetical protein
VTGLADGPRYTWDDFMASEDGMDFAIDGHAILREHEVDNPPSERLDDQIVRAAERLHEEIETHLVDVSDLPDIGQVPMSVTPQLGSPSVAILSIPVERDRFEFWVAAWNDTDDDELWATETIFDLFEAVVDSLGRYWFKDTWEMEAVHDDEGEEDDL